MRILVAGQKRFGRDVLALCLARGFDVAAVSCPAGGDDRLLFAAQAAALPVIPAGELRAARMPAGLDLVVAAHCHDFISRPVRLRARLGALGYHPSLLPRHRGRSAVEWAIRFGERVTGGSVYWLSDTVDGGPVAAQRRCFILPGDTAAELWARELAPLGLALFGEVFDRLAAGEVPAVRQETGLATWEPALGGVPPLWRPELRLIGFPGCAPAAPPPCSGR